jgi:uncharacterized membrane protein YphA (DoxX/SURF4 family)
MNIALWVAQGLVALFFLTAGIPKLTQPMPTLAKRLPWAPSLPAGFVRFIGAAEIVGAIGLIVPAATKIAPVLTIAAAIGLAVVMVSAIIFHATRKEYTNIAPSVVFLLFIAFVLVGRLAWVTIV